MGLAAQLEGKRTHGQLHTYIHPAIAGWIDVRGYVCMCKCDCTLVNRRCPQLGKMFLRADFECVCSPTISVVEIVSR